MNPWMRNLLCGGGGGGPVLPSAGRTMLAKLTSSLILDEGTGGPTWSRATKAWAFNELGYLEELASGCAFFGGARLVRNLVPTPSNTLAIAGTKTVTLTQAATLQFSMGAGAGTATFSGTGGATGTLAAGASRVSVNKTVTAGTFIVIASVDALVDLSIVDVTNYDASYVPEYVSVGVEASPYFGAGIDGAKYFETDWQGAPIAAANLLGFRREASAINNLLFSRTLHGRFATASYFSSPKAWVPTTTGSELVTNGTFASDVSGWTADIATVTWSAGKMRVATAGGYGWATQVLSLTVGTTYVITASFSVIAGGISSIRIHPDATRTSTPIKVQNSETPSGTFAVIFTATAATQILSLQNELNTTIEYDDISVKEATMSVSPTATGLDGIANTATTLTATAADAIILQPISLASAARCASAYVKRRTGTGTISFTQDGGSTWTDITSQINGSTWSRVQITSTLANPSVGFKISTSGDAIDVDCVQNEAGAVATSPIVTTAAAITRNADSDTYQTASNWSDTAGTAYIEAQPWQWSSGGLLGSATNGLLGSASNSGATAYDGTNTANGPTGTPSGRKKLALRWTGATMDVSVGGVIGTAGIYDGAMGLASLGIAVNSSGYFGPSAVWNYAMTDDEFKALTT
jgi:hypothetical protein